MRFFQISVALLMALATGLPTIARAQSLPVVAVFEIKDATKKKRRTVAKLTDYFRIRLTETGKFRVVDKGEQERELRRVIDQSKKSSYKACFDDSCQIPLGKELAADKILRGTLSKFGSQYVLSMEMIDLASAASVAAATDKSDGTEEGLMASVERIADKLSGQSTEPLASDEVALDVKPTPAPNAISEDPLATKATAAGPHVEPSVVPTVMIIAGWSTFAIAYITEVVAVLASDSRSETFTLAVYPVVGPILVDEKLSSSSALPLGIYTESNVLHYVDAGAQLVGLGVALTGHILKIGESKSDADPEQASFRVQATPMGILASGTF